MISKPGARVIGYGWRRWVRAIATLFLAGLLAGCGATAASTSQPSSAASQTPQPTALPTSPASNFFGKSTPLPAEVAARIKTALAEQTGLSTEQMTLSKVSPQTWNNACLGAAEPDELCAEVMTPGYAVTVSTPQRKYQLHTDQSASRVRME
ncbi:MAG: hypothetical protein OHK0037_37130 [Elainellaceae cyanobacterium]